MNPDRNRLVRLARERLDVARETEDDDAADVARKTLADLGVDEAGDDLPGAPQATTVAPGSPAHILAGYERTIDRYGSGEHPACSICGRSLSVPEAFRGVCEAGHAGSSDIRAKWNPAPSPETDLDRALRDDGRPCVLPAKPESRSVTVRAAFFLDVLDDLARVLALDDLTPEERIAYTEAQTNARASLAAMGLP